LSGFGARSDLGRGFGIFEQQKLAADGAERRAERIAPVLGARILSKLAPIDISEAYGKALETGRRDGKGGLSPRTVNHMHRVLYSALNQAERWNLIVRKPAALLEKRDRPKMERKSVKTIGAPATPAVLDAARERRLFVPLVLGTFCGLRRGEITALRWKSVDLDGAQLAVIASTEQTDAGAIREKEAKSGRARTIALPSLVVDYAVGGSPRQRSFSGSASGQTIIGMSSPSPTDRPCSPGASRTSFRPF
jgi:integrase